MIGQTVSHYRIKEKLGGGGMGVVYLAEDTRLDRPVAIKFLPRDFFGDSVAERRFEQEAKAAAALSHPHICTVYDVGQHEGRPYLIMECLHGETLKHRLMKSDRLMIEEILDLGIQIASGLEQAHARGIVHRDIKPANIFLTVDGYAKILDFGLAKRMAEKPATDPDTKTAVVCESLTDPGTVLGTVAYMSPEQVRGEALDVRSDLFSFGIVLYEMATGQLPFQGSSAGVVMSEILNRSPVPAMERRSEVPGDLDFLIRKALERKPGWRCQSATEILVDLRRIQRETISGSHGRLGRARSEELPSIAVLPFQNLSAEPDNDYFSDGLSEDLVNALSHLPGLKVASRTSAFRFRGSDLDIRQIGRQLDVGTVLEGSVRRAGSRLRVTAQLVGVDNGYQLWSARYDRKMADVFDIQDEIVASIVEALVPTLLGEASPAVPRSTNNLEAYELYLKGRHYWHQRSPATLRVAIQCFEETIKLDPDFALAYAGLADCYGILRVYGWISAEEGRPPAHTAMTQALKLAPSLWEVNFSRAFFTFYFEKDWRVAGPHFQKAIAVNPRSSLAQAYYGVFLATEWDGENAVAHTSRALELDPLSPFIHGLTAVTLYSLGRFEAAEQAAKQALELQADYLFGLWLRGLALCGLGRYEEAIEALERAATLSRAPIFVSVLGLGYARAGRADDARRLLHELDERASRGEYVPAFARLAIHVGQGDVAALRRTLATAAAEATPPFTLRATSGQFLEDFRDDPEIDRLASDFYARRTP